MWRVVPLMFFCFLLGACGGGNGSSTSTNNPTTGNPSPTPGGTSSLQSATVVDLTQGSAAGVDIAVTPPAGTPALNAQDLGVNPTTGQASASNTGGIIHRGATNRVILFGPGMNAQTQVLIAGPSDITVSNVTAIQATDNTPGVAFIATVNGNAALGARTVYLQNPNGDASSFTAGLEVVP